MLLGFYGLLVLALLTAEVKVERRAQFLFKPAAALCFILLAIQQGALASDYGLLILVGLTACAIGDVLLLARKSEPLFKSGMAAFAMGHLFYIFAARQIINSNMNIMFWAGSLLVGGALAFFVIRYLKPRIPKGMIWPVGGYTIIISAMIIYAMQTDFIGSHKFIVPAALLFAISDLFVARDRFITPNPKNALIITPFYFGAQALFALSVAA